jgi:hypothetical protein
MAWQLQWALRAHGVSIRLNRLLAINLVTVFYSLALPGELAGGGIGWLKLREEGSDGAVALVAIMVARMANLILLFGVGGVFWLVDGQMLDYRFAVFLVAVLVSIGAAYWLVSRGARILSCLPLPQRLQPSWHRFLEALTALRGLPARYMIALLVLAAVLNLCGVASHIVFARAVGLTMSVWTIGWIRSAVLILGLLPLSIGGFGIREGSLIFLLHAYGASPEQAVGYSILVVLTALGIGLAGAGLEAAGFWRKYVWMGEQPAASLEGNDVRDQDDTGDQTTLRSDA